MASMRTLGLVAAIVLATAFLTAGPAPAADDPQARAVMEKVDARDDGDNATSDMEMILIDKNGRKRVRKIASFSKDFGPDTYKLMFFLSPADVKDTGFLTYDYRDPDRDDDQWLYMPELRKTKRIASSDKSGSFMGSDFSYADMTKRSLEEWDYEFYRPEKDHVMAGHPVWIIIATPRTEKVVDRYGYTKTLLVIRKDNYVVIMAKNWVKEGGKTKFMTVTKLDRIDGIWVPLEMKMVTKKGKRTLHTTILRQHNVKFNQNLDDKLFTVRRLEKGL